MSAISANTKTISTLISNTSPGLERFWHPVALSDEVGSEPMSVWLLGEPWALVRLRDGQVIAARDRCPHRSAPMSAGALVGPSGDEWQCGYHGWRFGSHGGCVAIPALGPDATIPPKARLDMAAGVFESGGLVWFLPSDADGGEHPEALTETLAGPFLRVGPLEAPHVRVGAGPMIDNFCDIAHFPFLHTGTFGGDEPAIVDGLQIEESAWSSTCTLEHEFINREDPGVASGERPLRQRRRMSFVYHAPFAASLRLDHLDTGLVTVLLFAVQPERNDRCRVFTILARGGSEALLPDDSSFMSSIQYEQQVLEEDLVLQTKMPLTLDVAPNAEVHTRADKFTLSVRRLLMRCLLS